MVGGASAELVRLDLETLEPIQRYELPREPARPLARRRWPDRLGQSHGRRDPDARRHSGRLGAPHGYPSRHGENPASEPPRSTQGYALAKTIGDHGRTRILAPHVSSLEPGLLVGANTYGGINPDGPFFVNWVAAVDNETGKLLANPSQNRRAWTNTCSLPRARGE